MKMEEIMNAHKNLFATVLTYAAPSSNYFGDGENNRRTLQKITKDKKEFSIISPESMRNALREMLAQINPKWCNRRRLHNEGQLAVEFKEFPDSEKYADDFLFGFMVADTKAIAKNKKKPAKRDSILRMNLALSLNAYRFNATFHQSPKMAGDDPPFKNTEESVLYNRERSYTAYQYPFALSRSDCQLGNPEWTRALLKSIGELSNVAGGHANSYYEMSPASIVARLTASLVAGYDTYGFDDKGQFDELNRINENDLQGDDFWIGGEIVRKMAAEERTRLEGEGVRLYDNPQKLVAALSEEFLK
jgi:CRISPR-associated protein Cst2